ncbi:hypothetical protein MMC12_002736 [Toensbergia leucococca]|nr:hypothetical protein [Toensbergia leucococca]
MSKPNTVDFPSLRAFCADLPNLPEDLFLIVARLLSPSDLIRCRRVSRQWHDAFTNPYLLRTALRWHFDRAREVRKLRESGHLQTCTLDVTSKWIYTFDKIAARYLSLRMGRPRHLEKISLVSDHLDTYQYPVGRWHRTLEVDDVFSAYLSYHEPETSWTYNDGILVYADPVAQSYVLLDVESMVKSLVPFTLEGRLVRRVRLQRETLIVEWAEKDAYHELDLDTRVHRHFVSCFNVVPLAQSFPWIPRYDVVFRSQWKLHFLGLPLNKRDVFFSAHTERFYVLYIWQPNRSAWGEDEPIETLTVWDISLPSDYCPSQDPSGSAVPTSKAGPCVVKKLKYDDLDFYCVRQRDTPLFWKLDIDEDGGMVYVVEECCELLEGADVGHSRQVPGDLHSHIYAERVVGIPIIGGGPRWEDVATTSSVESSSRGICSLDSETIWMVTEPKKATCWRYKGIFPETGIRMDKAQDELAGIEFTSVWYWRSRQWIPQISIQGQDWNVELKQGTTDCPINRGIQGDERWIIGEGDDDEILIHRFDSTMPSEKQTRSYL